MTFTKESDDLFVINVQRVLTFEDLKEVKNKVRERCPGLARQQKRIT
jgi:hypothetical protein